MVTEVLIHKEIPKNPVVIEAFPSKGFVSTIAAKHMIDELGMEIIGSIRSDKIQSIAVIHDATPMYPIRIYQKDNLLLIFSEVNIPFHTVGEFTATINNWFKKITPSEVILLAGISGKETEKEHEIFVVTTHDRTREKLVRLNTENMTDGILTGISSDLLLFCAENKIPVTSLMAETHYTPDPLGSASMLKILKELLEIEIDTEKLIAKGNEVENVYRSISEQMKKGVEDTQEISGYTPMYG